MTDQLAFKTRGIMSMKDKKKVKPFSTWSKSKKKGKKKSKK